MKDTSIYLEACKEGQEFLDTQSSLAEAWNNCENVVWLLWSLRFVNYSDSALRLFACACVRETPLGDGRKVWDLLTDPRSRETVEVAERFARGEATQEELDAARASALEAYNTSASRSSASAGASAWDAAWAAAYASAVDNAWEFQANLLRQMIENPFVLNSI